MTTLEERMQILKMIQDGKISAEQGVQLLEAIYTGAQRVRQPAPPVTPTPPAGPNSTRWFRVQVTDMTTGKTRVNIRLPVGLVSAGVKMGARFAPQVEGLDPAELMRYLNSGETGKIIDVYNSEEGERVEVYIE